MTIFACDAAEVPQRQTDIAQERGWGATERPGEGLDSLTSCLTQHDCDFDLQTLRPITEDAFF